MCRYDGDRRLDIVCRASFSFDLDVTEPVIYGGGTKARFYIVGHLRFDCRSPECQLLPIRLESERVGEQPDAEDEELIDVSEPVLPPERPKRGLDRHRFDRAVTWLKRQLVTLMGAEEVKQSLVGRDADSPRRRLFRFFGRRFYLRFLKWELSAPYRVRVRFLLIGGDRDAFAARDSDWFEHEYSWDLEHEIHRKYAVFVFGISWLVAEGLALDRRALFAVIITLPATALVVTPMVVQLFAPGPVVSGPGPERRPGTAYWELSTGSRIAYSFFAAQGETARNPIVYVHGGLGRAVLDSDVAFFRQFSSAGFDIYLYDLVGTGLSDRLDDVREYAIGRHVLDLEAIHEMIRADRLILVAHAEGSEIAIRYMIRHRDRVERVVFYSPTSMWNDQDYFKNNGLTAVGLIPSDAVPGVRQTVALALGLYSPRTAEAYVSQEEMTAWADQFTDEGLMVCAGDGALAPIPESPGYNPYVGLIGDVTDDARPDPRRGLREVFVPTILLRGECDPVDWGVVQQYWEAVPNIRVHYVQGAGSMLHLSQPDLVKAVIFAFLNEEPMPLEPLSERAIRTALPMADQLR